MRRALWLVLALPSLSFAGNLSTFWVGDGGYKLAAGRQYPLNNCSTCTVGPFWDGTTAKLSVAKNEARGIMLWMWAPTKASSVTVTMSSLSGPSGASIANSASLPTGDTNYTQPIQEYFVRYQPIKGLSLLEWDNSITEEHDLPDRFQRPCTIGGSGNCIPNGGTVWTDRPDHDQYLPDIMVPYTLVAKSSFTVLASSSQGIGFRIFASSNQTPGVYTGTITVKEDVTVSTSIPFQLTVYNFALPDKPTMPFLLYRSYYNIDYRHYASHYPTLTDAIYTTHKKYDHLIHSLRMNPIGDEPVSTDSPNAMDVARFSGALYQATTGYSTAAPGVGTPDAWASIGTYGGWQSGWSDAKTNSATFCTHVSNWQNYFKTNFPTVKSFVYLSDEGNNTNVENERWATWIATVTACQVTGYKSNSFLTHNWPDTMANVPHVNLPCTTGWISASTTTWKAAETLYETTGSTLACAYNGNASWRGTLVTEDDGISPVVIPWAYSKRGVQMGFNWESVYWTDSNYSARDNDLWGSALTFGNDASYDSVRGRTGGSYTNGEGVLLYPGTDLIGTVNYGFDGPMPSLRILRLADGLADTEYLAQARAINPALTASIIQSIVPEVLWEHKAYDPQDPSYSLGGRKWSNDPNIWETARQQIAGIITGASSIPTTRSLGQFRFIGNARPR